MKKHPGRRYFYVGGQAGDTKMDIAAVEDSCKAIGKS